MSRDTHKPYFSERKPDTTRYTTPHSRVVFIERNFIPPIKVFECLFITTDA